MFKEENDKSPDFLLKGISIVGKARLLSRTNRVESIVLLKEGIKLINHSVTLEPGNLGIRIVRLRHFHGITLNSPVSLIETVKEDLEFLFSMYDSLTITEKGLYHFIHGEYYRLLGSMTIAKESYFKCISISPESLESWEAAVTLDTLNIKK